MRLISHFPRPFCWILVLGAAVLTPHSDLKAQPAPATPATPPSGGAPPAPAAAAPAQPPAQQQQPLPPQFQSNGEWGKLPRMQIERQFAGPLQDTIVQRLRDTDGTICYLYLPISVQHTPVTANGFVQYGPNTVGSISCLNPASPTRR